MTQTIPGMLHPDQFPQDEAPRSKNYKAATITIEVEEHERLSALYTAMWNFRAGRADKATTNAAVTYALDGLNVFYEGRDMRKVNKGGRPRENAKSKGMLQ